MDDHAWRTLNLSKLHQDADREAEPRIEALKAQVCEQLKQTPHRGDGMRAHEFARLMEQSLREGKLHPHLVFRHRFGCECGTAHFLPDGTPRPVLHDMACPPDAPTPRGFVRARFDVGLKPVAWRSGTS